MDNSNKRKKHKDFNRKDATIKKLCDDISHQKKQYWKYLEVMQSKFYSLKRKNFIDLSTAIYEY